MDTATTGHYLVDILALLLATVIIVPIFHALRLGAIIGYLTAGIILGPWGLGIIDEVDEIRHLAEFGVVFLLFILGIELKPDRLWNMRKLVFGLGLGQLLITATVIFVIAMLFGVSAKSAVIIGFGLALSSTAFCLQLLSTRGGLSTLMGRMSFSVLLLQDLAVVPLLALVSMMAGSGEVAAEGGNMVLQAIAIIIALLLAGRYLLPRVLDIIVLSRDAEVFIATAVLLVLGVGWIMDQIGLSMALGAFLAGVMLAESHYRHQIEADILPFRGILLGLFFIAVGMGIDFGLLWNQLGLIIGLTLGLMFLKAAILYGLARLSGSKHKASMRTATLLSQSGEFGFVIFGVAAVSGLLAQDLYQILVLVIALTMTLTPFVVRGTDRLLNRSKKPNQVEEDVIDFAGELNSHVILAGFGRVGARIGLLLTEAAVPYIAIDMRQKRVADARKKGFPVFYGDASQLKVLQAAGADRAKMIVVALDNREQVNRLVPLVRGYYPQMPIHARAVDRKHCAKLSEFGATTTISETLETSLRLTETILLGSGVDSATTRVLLDDFRHEYYSDVETKVSGDAAVLGELKH